MPRFDGTGPIGMGRKGRGLGSCGQGKQNDNLLSKIGNGFGRFGKGRGKGKRKGFGRGRCGQRWLEDNDINNKDNKN